jgi:uncharacterized protein
MSKKNNRRSFIQKGLTTAAGIGIFSKTNTLTQAEKLVARVMNDAMPKRKLGKTGYDVSLIGLGGQEIIENPNKKDEAIEIINRAIDLGVNYIDTAARYGSRYGEEYWGVSERNIGEVMKYRRNEVFLATKKSGDRTYDDTFRQFEQSLKNLQTDYIDLYQVHDVRTQYDFDFIFSKNGVLRAFEELKSEGSVRFLGITGHYDPIILKKAIEQYNFDCILMSLNAADVHYLPFQYALLDTAVKKNIGIIVMKVVALGRIFNYGGIISMAQALQYVYSFPISTAIIGYNKISELEQNVEITRNHLRYTELQQQEIEQLTAAYSEHLNYFKMTS